MPRWEEVEDEASTELDRRCLMFMIRPILYGVTLKCQNKVRVQHTNLFEAAKLDGRNDGRLCEEGGGETQASTEPMGDFIGRGIPLRRLGDSPPALGGIPLRRLGFLSLWRLGGFLSDASARDFSRMGIPSQDSSLGFRIETGIPY